MADQTLRELARMFAFGQGSRLLGENELPTSPEDEGKYLLRQDPATHGYQLLRVLRFNETGKQRGATFDYPIGRRTYTGNDMAALLSLLCGSTITAQPPKPIACQRYQDETPPYLLPENDPWHDTPSIDMWLQECEIDEVKNSDFPFRMVVEVAFESCGVTEYHARERVVNALNDFICRMPDYSENPELAEDGNNIIGASVRTIRRWEDHADYPANG